jgi:hypothetical protein
MILQTAVDLENHVRELLLNIKSSAWIIFYTDGPDFYAAVSETAKRRVDAVEVIHAELFNTYFKRKKSPQAVSKVI